MTKKMEAQIRAQLKKNKEQKEQANQADFRKLAKNGEISKAGYSENEIAAAVRCGVVSMSDAMNRDF